MAALSITDLMRRFYSGIAGVDPDTGLAMPQTPQAVNTAPAATATAPASRVLAAATGVVILNANAARRGATIVNRTGQEVFLRYGTGLASDTLFHWVLANGEKYEVPFGITTPISAYSVLASAAPHLLTGEYTA